MRKINGTDFRILIESYARQKLADHLKIDDREILHPSREVLTHPHDLEYCGNRYDVKSSSPVYIRKTGNMRVWDFSLRKCTNGKRHGQYGNYCEYFILVGMKNAIPYKVFLLPAKQAPTNHIRIPVTGQSKYNKYLI